jgi:hypothetical protein
MKRLAAAISQLCVLALTGGFALGITGNVSVELSQQTLNPSSTYNMNYVHQFNTFDSLFYGDIIFSSELQGIAQGFVDLECKSKPISFNTKLYGQPQTESVGLKELYAVLSTSFLNIMVGKHYSPWSQASFFLNTIDIINPAIALMRPTWEYQANPVLQVSVPLKFVGIDFRVSAMTRAVLEEDIGQTFLNLPLIALIGAQNQYLNAFVFGSLQLNQYPSAGASAKITLSIGPLVVEPYAEGILRGSPSKLGVTEWNSIEPLSNTTRFATGIVAGGRVTLKTGMQLLESLTVSAEYCLDEENWNQVQFQRYLNYLDKWRTETTQNIDYFNALAYETDFENSTNYIFASLNANNLLLDTMNLGCRFILNMQDSSFLVMPDLSYGFGDKRMKTGINAQFLFGSDEGQKVMPEVNKRTEFGTNIYTNRITAYFRVFFNK